MRTPLVACHRVDLVDDDRANGSKDFAPAGAGQQEIEALGRRDEDVRGLPQHRLPFRLRRVSGPDCGQDLGDARQAPQLGQRLEQVHPHVVGERLERRDVEHLRLSGERFSLADHRVEAGEESRERLAGSGRSGDQRVLATLDPRPAQRLRFRRRAEARLEPGAHRGVEAFEHGTDSIT